MCTQSRSLCACGRYVDDVVLISKLLCETCLFKWLVKTFQGIARFDADSEIARDRVSELVRANFLDATLVIGFESLSIAPKYKNELFAVSGKHQDCQKHTIEPFLGATPSTTIQRHRAEILGKLSRWQQIDCDGVSLIFLVFSDILCYVRSGFSFSIILKFWLKLSKDYFLDELIECF